MKKILIVFVSVLIFSFSVISVSAASVYGNVTESTSQIKVLTDLVFNSSDFDLYGKWAAARTGEYEYTVFYNIKDQAADYYRYSASGSGYNSIWTLTSGHTDSYSLQKNGYTVVGNIPGSLRVSTYKSDVFQSILKYTLVLLAVVLIFSVFRIRKTAKKGMNI